MKTLSFSGLIFLFFFLLSCGQSSNKNSNIDVPYDWKTINGSDFLIHYPENFDLDKSGQMGDNFILYSKQTSPQDLFRENINLYIQDLKGQNIDLDDEGFPVFHTI